MHSRHFKATRCVLVRYWDMWLGQDEDFNDEEMRAAFAAKLQDVYDMGRTDARL